ncbi:MAG: hypothetical protein H7A25_23630 [Leptospiraceae bacterium]|nr:hypothetical protein [Leptospiraceae bacterium]MCP5502912.1 hypothetical protein [Leptospiraceae bacterium]
MELFEKDDKYIIKGKEQEVQLEKARNSFKESYRDMTKEIQRVSIEEFSLYDKLCIWLYKRIHGSKFHLKKEQTLKELFRSTKGFNKIALIFKPYPDNSFHESEIIPHLEGKFKDE